MRRNNVICSLRSVIYDRHARALARRVMYHTSVHRLSDRGPPHDDDDDDANISRRVCGVFYTIARSDYFSLLRRPGQKRIASPLRVPPSSLPHYRRRGEMRSGARPRRESARAIVAVGRPAARVRRRHNMTSIARAARGQPPLRSSRDGNGGGRSEVKGNADVVFAVFTGCEI